MYNFALVHIILHYLTVTFLMTLVSTAKPKLIPFTYPRLYKVTDRNFGMDYFSKKLGIDDFLSKHAALKRTQLYFDWQEQLKARKETVRDIDACALKKTDPQVRAEDSVSTMGNKKCFNQCKLENKIYYQFLDVKLQKLIRMKSFAVDIHLSHVPVYRKPPSKKYFSCSKKNYKKYACECSYQNYTMKASQHFKKTFEEAISALYHLTPSPNNSELVEKQYKVPAKLLAFIISCHLVPTEVFGFLVWWQSTEVPTVLTTTTPFPIDLTSDSDESSMMSFGAKGQDRYSFKGSEECDEEEDDDSDEK